MKSKLVYLNFLLTCLLVACSNSEDEPTTVPVTDVRISPESISIECGETKQIIAEVLPENTSEKEIIWTSSNEEIVTVSTNGIVTGIKKGNADVKATIGGKSGVCKVSVTQKVQSIEVSPSTVTLTKKGETIQLTAKVTPEGAGDLEWDSSEKTVATVSDDGTVTAMGEGTAIITARADDKTASCTVTVKINIVEIEGNKGIFYLDGVDKVQIEQAIKEAANNGVTQFVFNGSVEALGLNDKNPLNGLNVELLDLSNVNGWQDKDADGLKELPQECFKNTDNTDYSGLHEVILPAEIQQIGDKAFYKCRNLKKITAPGVIKINEYSFQMCSKLEEVNIPNVTYICRGAFMSTTLKVVNFPKLQILEGSVFWLCSQLAEINLPEVTTIGDATIISQAGSRTGALTFANCGKLTKISLPKAKIIGDNAFDSCKSLTEIYLPEAKTIGIGAFINCSSLLNVNLPQVTQLGDDVFTNCESLSILKLTTKESISVQNSTFGPADKITKHVGLILNINKKDETWDEFWQEEKWKNHSWKSISFVE